jgi:HlyD family secretion protein
MKPNRIKVQIEKIEDQIKKKQDRKSYKEKLLAKYAEANEITAFGKPIQNSRYSEMILRCIN